MSATVSSREKATEQPPLADRAAFAVADELARLREERDRSREEARHLRGVLAGTQRALEEVRGSRSWRLARALGAPVRLAKRLLGRDPGEEPGATIRPEFPPAPDLSKPALAARHLSGEGVEIGALHNPLPLPEGARVRYVDRLPPEDLAEHYPDLEGIVAPDILGDAGSLPVEDASLDFVVGCHLLEHAPNPLGCLREWHRALKPGGKVFMALPDKRFTFDRDRRRTTLASLADDFERGATEIEERHLDDWLRHVEKVGAPGDPEYDERLRRLKETGYSIHLHVFEWADMLAMLASLPALGCAFEIVEHVPAREAHPEGVFVLRKPEA